MSPKKRFLKKKNRSSNKTRVGFFFLLLIVGIFSILAGGYAYLTAPYTTGYNNSESMDTGGETSQNNSASGQEKKDSEQDIKFTFFDILTKTKKEVSGEPQIKEKEQKPSKPIKPAIIEKKNLLKVEQTDKKELKPEKHEKKPEYVIQVSSFREKSMANALKDGLAQKGYQAEVESAQIANKGLWYRVFLVGGFSDRNSALQLIEKIKREEKLSAILKRSNK